LQKTSEINENQLPDLSLSKKLNGILDGKVGIVTGASRGIGEATAWAFVEAGARVVLAARDEQKLETIAKSINALHDGMAIAVATDVTDSS
jgi:NADP-dependent 3-hydroxy acid dehydrogenase YdfG